MLYFKYDKKGEKRRSFKNKEFVTIFKRIYRKEGDLRSF